MKLTDRHYRAMDLLLTGMPAVEVAFQVDVRAETVSRWQADDDFACELEGRRLQYLADIQAELGERVTVLARKALDALDYVLTPRESDDGGVVYHASDQALIGAAKVLLAKRVPDRKSVEHTGKVDTGNDAEAVRDAVRAELAALTDEGVGLES